MWKVRSHVRTCFRTYNLTINRSGVNTLRVVILQINGLHLTFMSNMVSGSFQFAWNTSNCWNQYMSMNASHLLIIFTFYNSGTRHVMHRHYKRIHNTHTQCCSLIEDISGKWECCWYLRCYRARVARTYFRMVVRVWCVILNLCHYMETAIYLYWRYTVQKS
jgi:hypothetical protein